MTVLHESETSRLIIRDNTLYFEKKEPIFDSDSHKEENISSNLYALIAEELTEFTSTIHWGKFDVYENNTYVTNDKNFMKTSKRVSPMSSPFSYAGVSRMGYPRLYFTDKTFIAHSHKESIITQNCHACETFQNR